VIKWNTIQRRRRTGPCPLRRVSRVCIMRPRSVVPITHDGPRTGGGGGVRSTCYILNRIILYYNNTMCSTTRRHIFLYYNINRVFRKCPASHDVIIIIHMCRERRFSITRAVFQPCGLGKVKFPVAIIYTFIILYYVGYVGYFRETFYLLPLLSFVPRLEPIIVQYF